MPRAQLHLEAEDVLLLDAAAARTGASRSELVRRAIREVYGGGPDLERRREALRNSAGAWADYPLTGAEYVQRRSTRSRRAATA